MKHRPLLHYLKTRLDSIAVITSLATIAWTDEFADLNDTDLAVLAALRRSNLLLQNAPLADIQSYLHGMDEHQQLGLVSNVKGILHEMEFVRLENEDGDSIYASWFEATNHPDTDIQLTDTDTGEVWEVQLKATDSSAYVQDWLNSHPDGDIAITEELAEKMGIPSSGFENEELTADTESLVDKLLSADEADTIWDYLPALSLLSLSLLIWELWQRYLRGEISQNRFQWLTTLAIGKKVVKVATLGFLLSLPIVGKVLGIALILYFLHGLYTIVTTHRKPTFSTGRTVEYPA